MVWVPVLFKHLPYCPCWDVCVWEHSWSHSQRSSVSWRSHFQAFPGSPLSVCHLAGACRECHQPFIDVLNPRPPIMLLAGWLPILRAVILVEKNRCLGSVLDELSISSLNCHAVCSSLSQGKASHSFLVGKCRLDSTGLSWYAIVLANSGEGRLSHTSSHHPSFLVLLFLSSRVNNY